MNAITSSSKRMNEMPDLKNEIRNSLRIISKYIGKTFSIEEEQLFLWVALTNESQNELKAKLNEAGYLLEYPGLETKGDSVLGLYVSLSKSMLYKDKSQITEAKKKYVSNKALQGIRDQAIEEAMIIRNKDNKDRYKFANLFERLIGAMFIAYGYEETIRFIENKIPINE